MGGGSCRSVECALLHHYGSYSLETTSVVPVECTSEENSGANEFYVSDETWSFARALRKSPMAIFARDEAAVGGGHPQKRNQRRLDGSATLTAVTISTQMLVPPRPRNLKHVLYTTALKFTVTVQEARHARLLVISYEEVVDAGGQCDGDYENHDRRTGVSLEGLRVLTGYRTPPGSLGFTHV